VAKVLVIGASRGIGFETVRTALCAGHSVRALARSAESIPIQNAGLDKVSGNALDSDTIRNALQDINAVIQTLGVDVSPRAVFERTTLFSQSNCILVDAMKDAGMKRLITVTGLGAQGLTIRHDQSCQCGGLPRPANRRPCTDWYHAACH